MEAQAVLRAQAVLLGQVLPLDLRALVEFRGVHRELVVLRGQVVREVQMALAVFRELVVILREQQAELRGLVAQVELREHREYRQPRVQVEQLALVVLAVARVLTEETEHRVEVVRRAQMV